MNVTEAMIEEAGRLETAWTGSGVYYQDLFTDDAAGWWARHYPARDYCLTEAPCGTTWVQAPEDFQQWLKQTARLREGLLLHGRGAWSLQRRTLRDADGRERRTWTLQVHDGRGYVHAPSGRLRSDDAAPGYADAMRHVIGMEVFQARQEARRLAEAAASLALVERHGWRVGDTLRLARVAGRRFSSGVLEAVSPTGYLTLLLTKQGSRVRYRAQCLAQSLELPA